MNSGVNTLRPSTTVQLAAVVLLRERQPALREADQRVVLHARVLLAVPEQLYRGEDQQRPEDHEHEAERRQQRRSECDEDGAQDQRRHDADDQHLLLVLGGHRERGHDHHEHEQVVDRQALLDHVAGEVLGAEVPPGDHAEHDAEADRDPDVEHRPRRGFSEPDRVRPHRRQSEIEDQEPGDQAERDGPSGRGDFEHGP
jgi:hypothetical protein